MDSLKSSKDHLMMQLNDPASQHAKHAKQAKRDHGDERASQMQAVMQPCVVPGMAASGSDMPLDETLATAPPLQLPAPNGILMGNPSSLWATDLFDCFQDIPSCIITFYCPSVAHGMVQSRLEGGRPWCAHCCLFIVAAHFCCAERWLLGTQRRATLRRKYGLPEDPCADCCVGWCCTPCAICQEWRELDRRGVPVAPGPI